MDILVILIEVFIGGGLLVIVLAPAFRLFKKAGGSQWPALVPGLNVWKFAGFGGRRSVRLIGFASFIAFPAFIVLYDLIMFQGESPAVTSIVLEIVFALLIAMYVFPFPMLSTTMAMAATVFLAIAYPGPGEAALPLTIIFVCLAALQAVWDYLGWRSILKRMSRPAWQAVFLFLPVAAALCLAVASLLAGPLGPAVILGVFLPALFTGFVYYYYIGYSAKVRYRAD
ncbi:MAG: hypothetical protein JXD23_11550 [Spirochaetales bacterium]|nr:hypothetical protein [Spirochaetales bacterium]